MTSAEFAARLNAGAGAAVWAEGLAEDPRWVFVVESDGISVASSTSPHETQRSSWPRPTGWS